MADTKGNAPSSGSEDAKKEKPKPPVTAVLTVPVDGFPAGRVVTIPADRADKMMAGKSPQAVKATPDQIARAGRVPALSA